MVEAHDDRGRANDENNTESSAEPPTLTNLDTSASNKQISAEPPRWRFVADAKRSSGYSSLAAGQHIQGKSSEELAAKYVAPDVSLYKAKREKPDVGKLQLPLPCRSHSKEAVEVGKLKLNTPNDETSSHQNIEVGELEGGSKKADESSELQNNVPDKPLKEANNNEKGMDNECPNYSEVKNGEASTGVGVAPRPDQKEGDQSDYHLDDETMKEATNLANSEAPNNGDVGESLNEPEPKRGYRYLYLQIFVLLTLVIVLGVLLGIKTSVAETIISSDNAAVTPDAPDPTIIANATSRPSFYPTIVSSYGPFLRSSDSPNKQPSTSPSNQPSSSPSNSQSTSPSKQPSTPPSKAPSANPSIHPTVKPTDVPSKKPSSRPTLPPTDIPSSKPTCSTEPKPLSLCLAINMSGSLCNGNTGALCIGCPQIIQSSDSQKSFCRDVGVNWNSCCSNFARVKELTTSIVNQLGGMSVDKSFSVVQFASDARVVSGLSSTAQTLSTISQLTFSGGLDNHAGAIQACQQTLSSSSNENKIIILVTDGETGMPDYVSEDATESAAVSARNEGTLIFPVLVSPDPPDTNEGATPLFSRISSSGEVFDFTDNDMPNVLQVQKELLNHVSC